jgi:plasmid stabilization system protein ParE
LKVVFAPEAEHDLDSAVNFLTSRNPPAAAQLVDGVRSLVRRLADGEFDGPEQQLRSGETVKSWPLSPYRLYYQRADEVLRIVRLYHQSRRPITRQHFRSP